MMTYWPHSAAPTRPPMRLRPWKRVYRTLAVAVDLIFGTPGESLESWRSTVDQTLALFPHHLSAYALTVETGTELWNSVRGGAPAPDPDDQADKYEYLALRPRTPTSFDTKCRTTPALATHAVITWLPGARVSTSVSVSAPTAIATA